ncbi:MAG: hypothetical protein GX458_13185 [Phyllobacteriaceae bacterium]|nr:hypothetical protein [Phyllobacteriaceae bacterium]
MPSLSRLLWRFVVAGLGFSLAVMVSVVIGVLAVGTVEAGRRVVDGDEAGLLAFVFAGMRGGVLLPAFAAIVWPAWAGAVVLGEATATRSLALHLLVAAGIAVVGLMGHAPIVGFVEARAAVAVGLSAGFAHWLVAGRSAGLLDRRRGAGAPRPLHDEAADSALSGRDPTP